MTKSKAGTVVITSQDERLRLRWSYRGKRYVLCLRLTDEKLNRFVANHIANQIQQDMALGHFDLTLEKYRTNKEHETVAQLFSRFIKYKEKSLAPPTLVKYRVISDQYLVKTKLDQRPAESLTIDDCFKFRDWLSEQVKPPTLKDRLTIIKAAWEWGNVKPNHWREVLKTCKVPPKPPPKPFTPIELKLLLDTCRAEYPFYGDFLEFWATLGCRPGELIGLQWKHVSEDCKTLWIGSQLTRRGERKPAKHYKSESLKLPPHLTDILRARKRGTPNSLVFPNGVGKRLDDTNFRERIWVKLLKKCELEYRKPYALRATVITRLIESGMAPAQVAKITRNSTRVIYENYLGSTVPEVEVPGIF